MADVARLLPRHWDGQRLLRFLAGLALLALTFAAHAGWTEVAASPADRTTVDAPAPVAGVSAPVTGVAGAVATGVDRPAFSDDAPPAGFGLVALPAPAEPAQIPRATTVAAGGFPAPHGSRGPPSA